MTAQRKADSSFQAYVRRSGIRSHFETSGETHDLVEETHGSSVRGSQRLPSPAGSGMPLAPSSRMACAHDEQCHCAGDDAAAKDGTAYRYVPRDPDDSIVAQVVRQNLGELQDRIASDGSERRLPQFVIDELRAVGSCHDFTRGFIRLRCDRCKRDRILPFS